MRSDTDRRSWRLRRSDRRAEAARPAHSNVEAQLRTLSTQWRRNIPSHVTGLRPLLDLEHDSVRGSADAKVTLVEYGDFESESCKAAVPVIRELRARFGDELRVAFRHFPIADAHPLALGASVAALAAGAQGSFWAMHDRVWASEVDLSPKTLRSMATKLDLDMERYDAEIAGGDHLTHVFEDYKSGIFSGVNGCPTFFVNERRLDWDFDAATLESSLTRAIAVVDEAAGAPA
jgi:protein-disulfide isomerase